MAICALILGAGFTPAVPSTVEPSRPAPVSFNATAAPAPAPQSTVDEAAPVARFAEAVAITAARAMPDGRSVGAAAGRAPPAHPA
ncbi:hypothetical protein ACPPVO_55505 [Dactylosporangium sp. McL0621]|uniref:hypothetical protein n=1 Tax=Dactylosporangium sp. McL0621 TaxID=3415678 RepID=UPI003CECE718